MPRRSQREVARPEVATAAAEGGLAAVAERTEAHLEEQRQRRREAAQRGAQTRRQRREQQDGEAQPQVGAESGTQGHVARRSRPRVHADLLTVAIRGEFANKMRALSESTGMSLAKLLKDSLLVYEQQTESGYEPGTTLANWQPQQTEE